MIYVKGRFCFCRNWNASGLAGAADVELCSFFVCGNVPIDWTASGSTEKRHTGYTLGAGFDWMVWQNVSFGVDYTYVNLGSEAHTGTLNGDITFCECGFDFSKKYKIDVDPEDIHYVNARLTVHFNGPSP